MTTSRLIKQTPACPRRPRGLTLPEMVISTVLVGVTLVVALNLVGTSKHAQQSANRRHQGHRLAQSLICEILRQGYADPVDGPDSFGLSAAETATGDRSLFDDVDDYDMWQEDPPENKDGTLPTGLDGWTRTVRVNWVNPSNPNQNSATPTGVKRIDVGVEYNSAEMARLSAIKSIGLPPPIEEPPGLIAHWKLDETTGSTAADSVGGHDGTLGNAPTWTTGHIDNALSFDGWDDYVDLTSDQPLDDVFNGGATVMAWIYPTGWGKNGLGRVFDKSSSASQVGNGWALLINQNYGNTLVFGQGFKSNLGAWRAPNGSIQLNTWQHIAVVYDASSTANDPIIYVNGSPLAITEFDTPKGALSSDASINLRLGNHAGDTSRTFKGKIDDARIYGRMLDEAEISAIAGSP